MPRLNHGTLLENLVVLEVARTLGGAAGTLEIACAFAMPPLTQLWHKTPHERGNNPRFNSDVVSELLAGQLRLGPALSYSALLTACLNNEPRLPVVLYADESQMGLPSGGPNGALLVALLRQQAGRATRIWSNDLADRLARYRSPDHDASSESPRTTEYARALRPPADGAPSADTFCDTAFPDSIEAMAAWREPCDVRLGFLDPDSYVTRRTAQSNQVDRSSHALWLEQLHDSAGRVGGVMFFASQNAPTRPELIEAFHEDAVTDYPHCVVFRHGNFMVGVKLRNSGGPDELRERVERAWADWSEVVGRRPTGLSAYTDGIV